jgi:protein TonB
MPPLRPVVLAEAQPPTQNFSAPAASLFDRASSFSSSATPERILGSGPQLQAADSPSGSKKALLIAAAAVVVLGAIGGGYMLRGHSAAETTPPASNTVTVPASQPVATPAAPSAAVQSTAAEVAPAARPATPAASSTVQPPAARAPEPLVASNEPVIPPPPSASELRQSAPHTLGSVGKLSQPVARRAATATSAELPPVLPASASATPIEANLLNAEQNTTLAAPAVVVPPSLTGGHVLQPKLISSQAPSYPPTASAQRIQGDVVVDALVDVTGKVTATKVISGQPLLQQAAMNAVRAWKYEPARLDGEAIPTHIQVKITFRLP